MKRNELNRKKGSPQAVSKKKAPNAPRPWWARHVTVRSQVASSGMAQTPAAAWLLEISKANKASGQELQYPEGVAPRQHERGNASTASCSSSRSAPSGKRVTRQLCFTPRHACFSRRRAKPPSYLRGRESEREVFFWSPKVLPVTK